MTTPVRSYVQYECGGGPGLAAAAAHRRASPWIERSRTGSEPAYRTEVNAMMAVLQHAVPIATLIFVVSSMLAMGQDTQLMHHSFAGISSRAAGSQLDEQLFSFGLAHARPPRQTDPAVDQQRRPCHIFVLRIAEKQHAFGDLFRRAEAAWWSRDSHVASGRCNQSRRGGSVTCEFGVAVPSRRRSSSR